MIHKYQQWLEESEKMEAADPAATETPATDVTSTETPAETPSATETPAEEAPATETPAEDASAESEIEQFHTLDTTRRDAIKAFKKKQEEFLEIPDDVRKNPVEEADKTKVETLKTELITLNQTMKDAIKAWDSFNSKALGLEEDGDDSEDLEP